MSDQQLDIFRYFIKLAYDGKNYCGWQIQKNAVTVQEVINHALSTILKEEINVVGCGRTDTGVHARVFYAHFDISRSLSSDERDILINKLNSFLSTDIVIYEIVPVKSNTHARFDATSRTYEYWVSGNKDPFQTGYSYFVHGHLDIPNMNKAARLLLEFTDFTSFSKVNTQVKTNNCNVTRAVWKQQKHMLIFTITADRFLRNMVRAIVGTLLDVGKGKTTQDEFIEIIESKNRSSAGLSVPANGLFLTNVSYPPDLIKLNSTAP